MVRKLQGGHSEALELLECPEVHLLDGMLRETADGFGRVAGQTIVFHRVVEDARELRVDRAQVGGLVSRAQQLLPPAVDGTAVDGADDHVAEEGKKMVAGDVALCVVRLRLEAQFGALEVGFDQHLEGYLRRACVFIQKLPLPLECLALGGEARFLLLPALAGPVLVVKGAVPAACVILVCRHGLTSFLTIFLMPGIWYNKCIQLSKAAYLLTPCPLPYMFRQGPKTRSGAATADVALTREQES